MFSNTVPQNSIHRFKYVMGWHGISPRNSTPSWRTVWLTAGASSWIFTTASPTNANVIEAFKVIYYNDKVAAAQGMSSEERLLYHQAQSRQTMDNLKAWLQRQFDEKLIEPNSAMGEAINYLLKRWESMTLFLRKAGAPLDNNVCERALKKAILHRKNAMFYKTRNGAYVGDIFMSLIYTCELNGANAFDYLNQLQLNASDLAEHPDHWMPWNYRDKLATDPSRLTEAHPVGARV